MAHQTAGESMASAENAGHSSLDNKTALVLILLAAFALRAGFAVYWHNRSIAQGSLFSFGDSHSYWTLSKQISAGKDYQYGSENARIFRAPVLPLLLAPFAACTPYEQNDDIKANSAAVLAARLFFCLFGTAAVWLIMEIAVRLGGPCSGYAAGSLAAVYPSALGMSATILSEAVFLPLMCAHILLWQVAWTHHGKAANRSAVGAGIVAGLAVLTRPSWLLFTPFLLGLGICFGPRRRHHAQIGVLALLAFSLTMTPWWARSASITGKFVPSTLQVGPSLYDGLNPQADGGSAQGMDFMKRLFEEQLREDAAATELESTLEYRLNQRATRAALDWATSHPAQTFWLALSKFMRTWSLWPDGGEIGSPVIRLGITLGSFGTLLLACVGLRARSLQQDTPLGWQTAVCWAPCLYFTLLHMVFVGSIRYREPAVFLLCALAGCGIAYLFGCKIGTPKTFQPKTSQ